VSLVPGNQQMPRQAFKNGILPAKKNTIMMNDEEWKRFEEIAFDD
jgi:hypothetical protein